MSGDAWTEFKDRLILPRFPGDTRWDRIRPMLGSWFMFTMAIVDFTVGTIIAVSGGSLLAATIDFVAAIIMAVCWLAETN